MNFISLKQQPKKTYSWSDYGQCTSERNCGSGTQTRKCLDSDNKEVDYKMCKGSNTKECNRPCKNYWKSGEGACDIYGNNTLQDTLNKNKQLKEDYKNISVSRCQQLCEQNKDCLELAHIGSTSSSGDCYLKNKRCTKLNTTSFENTTSYWLPPPCSGTKWKLHSNSCIEKQGTYYDGCKIGLSKITYTTLSECTKSCGNFPEKGGKCTKRTVNN